MKQLLIVFITFFALANVFGQKTEFMTSLNSGMFSFSGAKAMAITFINYNDQTEYGYINNPYGSRQALGYGLSLNVKRVSKWNVIFGVEVGYESLKSKVLIEDIYGYDGTSTYRYDATGKGFLNHDFLNSYPFIGYRFIVNKICLDVTGGLDFAYILNLKENGTATATNGMKYTISNSRTEEINFDLRPRIQLSAYYGKTGMYLGYSYGLSNYLLRWDGGTNNEAYARLIRFGITYRIK